MNVRHGIPIADLDRATELYWGAFGQKLDRLLGPRDRALTFIRSVIRADHAFGAYDRNGELLGVAGYKSSEGAFVGGTIADMRQSYGFWGGTWRGMILTLLERDTENRRFLMDGIAVAESARGLGIGTALLDAVISEAHKRGYLEVRLDVIDNNPRARALYERCGFNAIKDTPIWPLHRIFGFRVATTMVRKTTEGQNQGHTP